MKDKMKNEGAWNESEAHGEGAAFDNDIGAVSDAELDKSSSDFIADTGDKKSADIVGALAVAKEKIDRAQANAKAYSATRNKDAQSKLKDEEKARAEREKKRIDTEKQARVVAEERMAAMSYAETYRQRLREQRLGNISAAKLREQRRRDEERAEAKAKEEQSLRDSIEQEKAEARERSARFAELLGKFEDRGEGASLGEALDLEDALYCDENAEAPTVCVNDRLEDEAVSEATDSSCMQEQTCTDCGMDSEYGAVNELHKENTECSDNAENEACGFTADEAPASDAQHEAEGADGVISVEGMHGASILHIEGTSAGGITVNITENAEPNVNCGTGAAKAVAAAGAAAGVSGAMLGAVRTELDRRTDLTDLNIGANKGEPYYSVDRAGAAFMPSGTEGLSAKEIKRLEKQEYMKVLAEEKARAGRPVSPDGLGPLVPNVDISAKTFPVVSASFGGAASKLIQSYDIEKGIEADAELGSISRPGADSEMMKLGGLSSADLNAMAALDFHDEQYAASAMGMKGGRINPSAKGARVAASPIYPASSADEQQAELERILSEGMSKKERDARSREHKRERAKEEREELKRFAAMDARKEFADLPKQKKDGSREDAFVHDRKNIALFVEKQKRTDLMLIRERIDSEIRQMRLDKGASVLKYASLKKRDKRQLAKTRYNLSRSKKRLKLALKLEEADNSRYYDMVLRDLKKEKLHKRTNLKRLEDLRAELITLLNQRDVINSRLCELYAGKEHGGRNGDIQQNKAKTKGMKRDYRRHRSLAKTMTRMRVTLDERQAIYRIMDEQIEIKGQIAKLNFTIKKQKAKGGLRRECQREIKKLKREYKFNEQRIKRLSIRALRSAKKRNKARTASMIGWISLILLIAAGALVYIYRGSIFSFFKNLISSFMQ